MPARPRRYRARDRGLTDATMKLAAQCVEHGFLAKLGSLSPQAAPEFGRRPYQDRTAFSTLFINVRFGGLSPCINRY